MIRCKQASPLFELVRLLVRVETALVGDFEAIGENPEKAAEARKNRARAFSLPALRMKTTSTNQAVLTRGTSLRLLIGQQANGQANSLRICYGKWLLTALIAMTI